MLTPLKVDFKNMRLLRQTINNKSVYECIKQNNLHKIDTVTNKKKFERLLTEMDLTKPEFLAKCRALGDFTCEMAARLLAKCASRQGSRDEMDQLKTCNKTAHKCGVFITNLNQVALRPTKDGRIVSQKDIKSKCIKMDCCLKSFDASISGRIRGYISAKVAMGKGGHQDNVFEELDTIASWWKDFKSHRDEVLVILIDTDLMQKKNTLKIKYSDVNNILICDHVEFQCHIIHQYYSLDKQLMQQELINFFVQTQKR
jgi:hypothetical protein